MIPIDLDLALAVGIIRLRRVTRSSRQHLHIFWRVFFFSTIINTENNVNETFHIFLQFILGIHRTSKSRMSNCSTILRKRKKNIDNKTQLLI